MSLASALIFE